MKKKGRIKWISLILMLVCLQTTIVLVIPHHHHHHGICLLSHHTTGAHGDSTEGCGEDACVTHLKAVFQQKVSPSFETFTQRERDLNGFCLHLFADAVDFDLKTFASSSSDKPQFCRCVLLRPSPQQKVDIGRAPPI